MAEGFYVKLPEEEEKAFRSYIFNMTLQEMKKAMKDVGFGKEFWTTRKEVKEYFGIGDETLDRLISQGMPVIRLGERGFRFHKPSVIDFILKLQ